MTIALTTLLFLAAGWLAVQAIVASLDGKMDRIAGALRGEAPVQTMPISVRVSPRYPSRPARRVRSLPPLRAAA